MNLKLLTLASQDLIRGKRFYESQEEGLGDYFFDSLSSDIESLLLYAGIHKKIRGYYCLLSRRFPYAVYYKVELKEIRVFRVLDCRQNPSKTETALKREPEEGGNA